MIMKKNILSAKLSQRAEQASEMNGNILSEAQALITGDRRAEYGAADASFGRIATMWTAYLGRPVTGHDVACMMALLKLAREAHCHKADNLIDAAGYIGLAGDMADPA